MHDVNMHMHIYIYIYIYIYVSIRASFKRKVRLNQADGHMRMLLVYDLGQTYFYARETTWSPLSPMKHGDQLLADPCGTSWPSRFFRM